MKVFYAFTASVIDSVFLNNLNSTDDYKREVEKLLNKSLFNTFGITAKTLQEFDGELVIPNSKILQYKWAEEKNLNYNEKNWKQEILSAQIEEYQPDILYTGDYKVFNEKMKKFLPRVSLYALWNASPMPENIDLSYFDVGLSFNDIYQAHLKKRGIKNIEYNSFYFDPSIKISLDSMKLRQDIDVSFCGRYSSMFKDRNQFLFNIYHNYKNKYNIEYYLLLEKRFRGLIPMVPWKLLKAYNQPVFLEDMLKVFNKSKIVLNTHSNITGKYKGNMRVFETLGIGAFMLSDFGSYPEYLEDGIDFVTYKNNRDMLEKIEYYLTNDKEREEIAQNGYLKIADRYNTDLGAKNIQNIFQRYL